MYPDCFPLSTSTDLCQNISHSCPISNTVYRTLRYIIILIYADDPALLTEDLKHHNQNIDFGHGGN